MPKTRFETDMGRICHVVMRPARGKWSLAPAKAGATRRRSGTGRHV